MLCMKSYVFFSEIGRAGIKKIELQKTKQHSRTLISHFPSPRSTTSMFVWHL